jgi:hypothetical protein
MGLDGGLLKMRRPGSPEIYDQLRGEMGLDGGLSFFPRKLRSTVTFLTFLPCVLLKKHVFSISSRTFGRLASQSEWERMEKSVFHRSGRVKKKLRNVFFSALCHFRVHLQSG